jgi:hypothetical protein
MYTHDTPTGRKTPTTALQLWENFILSSTYIGPLFDVLLLCYAHLKHQNCVENGAQKYFKARGTYVHVHHAYMHAHHTGKLAAPTQQTHVVEATSEPSESIMGPHYNIVDSSNRERAGPRAAGHKCRLGLYTKLYMHGPEKLGYFSLSTFNSLRLYVHRTTAQTRFVSLRTHLASRLS